VELWLYFPKTGFPGKDEEVEKLFKERNCDQKQKKTKCKSSGQF